MTCDGKERECIYYLRKIHGRATFWHGSTLREAARRFRNNKGDYTIDLGERYEEDSGTCICDAGCEKLVDDADWGKSVETLYRRTRVIRDPNVPHIIVYERRVKVTKITAIVQCLDPKSEIKHQLEEGEDVEEEFAKMREQAMKGFELEYEIDVGQEK